MGIFKKVSKAVGKVAKMSLGLAGGLIGGKAFGGILGGLFGKPKLPEAESAPAPAAAVTPPDRDVETREQDMRRAMTAAGSDYASFLGSDPGELDEEGKPKKKMRASRELLG